MSDLFRTITGCDFGDLPSFATAADHLLTGLDADRHALLALVNAAAHNPDLIRLCEHYDILDKLVLHDDPTGWRLRLHIFAPGYFDRPHNHRWTYASRILSGSYTHTLYGTDDQFDQVTDAINVTDLVPRMVRTERAEHTYTLHHSVIHSVTAQPYTTSLIVRGPAVKDRFLVTDRLTTRAWWQHGAATEPPEEAARKRMCANQIQDVVSQLIELSVLPPTVPSTAPTVVPAPPRGGPQHHK